MPAEAKISDGSEGEGQLFKPRNPPRKAGDFLEIAGSAKRFSKSLKTGASAGLIFATIAANVTWIATFVTASTKDEI